MSRAADRAPASPRQQRAEQGNRRGDATASWLRLGRSAAYLAGGAFMAQTILYLLDTTGVLTPQATYVATERGMQQDLIDYYFAYNERMHGIWWNVALRDLLGPIGDLALIIVVIALLHAVGTGAPREELGRMFVILGASAHALSDVMFLSHLSWWREGGFQATPDLIAVGRADEIVDNVGSYVQSAGSLILALGLICLKPAVAAGLGRWHRLGALAYVQAGTGIASVVARVAGADTAADGAAAASGLIVGPALAILVGRALGARSRAHPPVPGEGQPDQTAQPHA